MALNKSNINKLNEFLTFLEKASNYLTDNDLSSWFCLDPRKARPQYIKEFNARSLPNFIAKAVGDIPASEVEQYLADCRIGEIKEGIFKAFTETNIQFVAFCDQVTTSSNITLSQCMKFQLYQSISTKAFHSATNRVLKQTKECMKSKLGTLAFRTKLKAICSNDDELMNKILELFKKNQHQNQESHVNSDDTSKNSDASVVGEKRDHAAMQANKSTKSRKKYTRP